MASPRSVLAEFLETRRDEIAARLLVFAHSVSTENDELQQGYRTSIEKLLRLLTRNMADPADRRIFEYAEQRAPQRFGPNIPLTQLLRFSGTLRHAMLELLTGSEEIRADPTLLAPMLDLIDAQLSELDTLFTVAFQRARDEQWQASENKYFSLFENASEAIVSFRPGNGKLLEANVQAERLTGLPRAELLRATLPDLFSPEGQEQARWLVAQDGGTSNLRLEDMAVRRADGLSVPVSLSCNWLQVDGHPIAQAILRDVTLIRQMQRELQSHAEELEARVAERTAALQDSEERYRALFLQEQRRARQLSLVNDVQRCALAARETEAFLHGAAQAIQKHFRPADVMLLLHRAVRDEVLHLTPTSGQAMLPGGAEMGEEFAVVAEAGGYGLGLTSGATLPAEWGVLGEVSREQRVVWRCPARDSSNSIERLPGVHREAQAELAAPVWITKQLVGIIWVRSEDSEAFVDGDVAALETVAAIAAAFLSNGRMLADLRELAEFNQTLIDTMLHSLMVVDREGHIKLVNDRLCRTLHRERRDLLGRSLEKVFGPEAFAEHDLRDAVQDVTENGTPREEQEVHVRTPEATLIFDLRMSRVYFRGEAQAVVLLINLTLRWRKTYQLQMMNEMGRLFQASLDINQVLFSVLTCITAGSALGFNRAFLFLRDEEREAGAGTTSNALARGNTHSRDGAPSRDGEAEVLRGAMALGPSSSEEASRIWRELGREEPMLGELLAQTPRFDAAAPTPLQAHTLALRLDLNNPCFEPLARATHEKRALRLSRADFAAFCAPDYRGDVAAEWRDECRRLLELLTTEEFAVAPLVAKERVVGLVMADNLYSGAPIETDDVQLLDTLAQQAGLTVDNALTYQALQKSQTELVAAVRLGAIGEMAARVSHEIRNPLATIGGFARSILKRPENIDGVLRKTGVIVQEVERLEELLTDLLDMARARRLDLQPHNVNAIVEHALLLAEADIRAAGVEVHKHLAPLPPALVDRARLLQALLNTIRNAAQAMPNGGMLTLSTRLLEGAEDGVARLVIEIADTGIGMSEQARKRIFDPFFSTKISGSGLGLAVTRRIIEDHNGDIEVQSQEGAGTTFLFSLPLRPGEDANTPPISDGE